MSDPEENKEKKFHKHFHLIVALISGLIGFGILFGGLFTEWFGGAWYGVGIMVAILSGFPFSISLLMLIIYFIRKAELRRTSRP